jgi:hypothetical protein
MDFDLIPVCYDLFKRHFPQILGQALVLNYGWIHAGIWSVVKTMLSEEAKRKLVFVNVSDLPEFIPLENIPIGKNG